MAPSLAFGSLVFLNQALAQFDASRVVPIYISTIIVTSTISGGIYFGELQEISARAAAGLAAGVALVVVGVCVQASRAAGATEPVAGGGAAASQAGVVPAAVSVGDVGTDSDGVLPLPAVRSSTNGHAAPAERLGGSASLDAPLLASTASSSAPVHRRQCSNSGL